MRHWEVENCLHWQKDCYFDEDKHVVRHPSLGKVWTVLTNGAVSLARRLRNQGTTCICVCDSEADMFEIFSEPRVENSHLLIRACQDRTVEAAEPYVHIRDVVYSKKAVATKKMVIRERIPAIAGTSNPR